MIFCTGKWQMEIKAMGRKKSQWICLSSPVSKLQNVSNTCFHRVNTETDVYPPLFSFWLLMQNREIGDILQLWCLCTVAPQPQDPGQQILWRRLSRWDWAGRCWSRPPHTRSERSQAADTNTGAKRINRFSLIRKSLIQHCVMKLNKFNKRKTP